VAKAVHFDGATKLSLASYSGADSPLFSFSLWFRVRHQDVPNGGGPAFFVIDSPNAGTLPQINGSPDSALGMQVSDATGINYEYWDDTSVTAASLGDIWVNFLGNAKTDLGSGLKIMQGYWNDTTSSPAVIEGNDGSPFNMGFNGKDIAVPMIGSGFLADYIGDLADVWIAPGQFIDFSVAANRRKFIDANGKPVDLGSDCSAPTGIAPSVCFSGDSSGFVTNKGTGGAFNLTGTLTNASTSPSN
jgi:hypothetical protein